MRYLLLILLLVAPVPLALAQPAPAPTTRPGAAPAPAIPTPATPAPAAPGTAAAPDAPEPEPVDLNLATLEELQTLPGIGPARARTLISHRPYASVAEAATKGGLPRNVLDGVRDRLVAFQLNVNGASREEMIRLLPGIGEARADSIVRNRPYRTLDEVAAKNNLPQAVYTRLRPVLRLR